MPSLRTLALALALLAPFAAAHFVDDAKTAAKLHWAERHMQEEHHIYNFDAGAFFHLHDFDNSGTWTRDEVLRTYGLEQPDSTETEETKEHVWKTVSELIGAGSKGITMHDFQAFVNSGNTLPDFDVGFAPPPFCE